jgi:NAD(P)-dependent dehydrogenase (short-subunit alcohol dehydrogenase family)
LDTLRIDACHYTVTGAGRGIGLKTVEVLSARPDTVVFAGVRSVPLASDSELARLVEEHPGMIFPVKINSADKVNNEEAARFVREKMGKVDVVIANAGEEDGPFSTGGSGMTRKS